MLPFGDLGPATVIWDVDGTPVDLGPCFGGVNFTDEVKTQPIHWDGYGETPVDAVFTGRETKLTVAMTSSQLAQLAKVIPSANLAGDVLTVKSSVGTQMRALAKKVTIKKLVDNVPSSDPDEWLTLFLAYPVANANWKFDAANQRVTDVSFVVFPLDTSGHVGEMWAVGE